MLNHDDTYLFTSESVTEGHPDKIADQISDAVLDAILAKDKNAHVACETFVTTGLVVVAGEVSTNAYVDVQRIVRDKIVEIGYSSSEQGFDGRTAGVLVALDEQSKDIAQGVNDSRGLNMGEIDERKKEEFGAGDQGMMFGYATNETSELMPLPITLAHKLTKRLAEVRKQEIVPYLRPDGKAQVTVKYDSDNQPIEVDTVVVSTQHAEKWDNETLGNEKSGRIYTDIVENVIRPALGEWWNAGIKIHVNPTGAFVIGGPQADAGLTGRKIIVDTYGGAARHGGGAFSGKDATKVDRSAAYAARWVAKNIVEAELASRCEIQLAYAIGVAKPVSIHVDTFDTGSIDDRSLELIVNEVFDLRPAAIIEQLGLAAPIYGKTSTYGHFGRPELDFPWEQTNRVDALKEAAKRASNGTPVTA